MSGFTVRHNIKMKKILITASILLFSNSQVLQPTTVAEAAAQSYIPVVPSNPTDGQQGTSVSGFDQLSCNSDNMYWSGYKCICKVGFLEQGGICVRFSAPSPQDQIERPAEFIDKISNLYKQPTCTDPNSEYNGNSCECKINFIRINGGVCQSCPVGSQYNAQTKTCICS